MPKITKAVKRQYEAYLETNDITKVNADGLYNVLRQLYLDAFILYAKKSKTLIGRIPKVEKKAAPSGGAMGFSDILIEAFIRWFSGDILNTSQGITETTIDIISRVINDSVRQGYNARKVAKQIAEEARLSRQRALLIVRTEVTGAANAGSYYAALKSELVMQKRWIATSDKRTRPDHREVNGTIIDLEKPFEVGTYKMLYPGDKGGNGRMPVGAEEVCNCRCTLGYIPKRDEKGRLILKAAEIV